jgi:predicted transcriptional regulator
VILNLWGKNKMSYNNRTTLTAEEREQELVETRRRVVDDLYATEAEIDELLQDEAVKTYLKLKEDYRVNRFNVLSEKKRILDGELQTLDSFILPNKDPRSK